MMGRGGGGRGRLSRNFDPRNEDKGRQSGWGVAPPSRHLWVGNLSPQVTPNLLSEHFLKFGDLENIAFIPGRSYAFVNYIKEEDAIIASRGLQGFILDGMPLRVEFAKGDKPPVSSQYEDYPQYEEDRYSFKRGEPFIQRETRPSHVSPNRFSENKGNKNAEPSEMLWIGFPTSLHVDEMMLRKAFSPFGEIEKITTFPGRSYAFVRYRNIPAACRAKEALQGRVFGNPRVSICFAKSDVASAELGRNLVDSPHALHSRLNFHSGMGGRANELFQGERSFESPVGELHVAPPRFGSNFERMSADSGDMGFGRNSSIRTGPGPGPGPNFSGTLEHIRLQELGPQRRVSEDPYEHHRSSPAAERDAPWHDPPFEMPRRGPILEDSWGAGNSSFPLLKKLKADSFPDRELPEYPFTDLEQEKRDAGLPQLFPNLHDNYNKSFDSGPFGYKGVPHHPMTLPNPPSENDESWRTFDGFNAGPAPLVQSSVNMQRHSSEPRQPHLNKEWKWEGTIAKGGTPVCRARCFPVGKVLDFMLPEFLDCTARTGLDMLAKHYYQAAGTWVVFFVPETDADIVFYNEFMHYLGEKQRAAVAKLGEKTTLFLVPPSEFSEQVLKVPGKLSISGVILKFQQPSTNFSSLHHPLEAMESKLPVAMQRPPEGLNLRDDTSLRKLDSPNFTSSSQGQSYFHSSSGHFPPVNPTLALATKQSDSFAHSEPVHPMEGKPGFHGENRHDHLRHQSPAPQHSWSSDVTNPSIGPFPPPPRNAPPHSFGNSLVENNPYGNRRLVPGTIPSTYTPENSNIPPLPPSKFLPQQETKPHPSSSMPLPLEPEQLAQLAAILGQQKQSGKEPFLSTDGGGKQASLATNSNLIGHASGSSGSVVSQFTHASVPSGSTVPQVIHASAPSGSGGPQLSYGSVASASAGPHLSQAQHELHQVQQHNTSQQAPNNTTDETEADPQQRLQATLKLAAALLQQIQQQGKT